MEVDLDTIESKNYGSDPISFADYRTPSLEYMGRSAGVKGIAEGYADDPSVTQLATMLGGAGRQQLGAARSADMVSGAARGRLGRGAQQQTQSMAPGMLSALRAQTQQAAQQQHLGRTGYQRAMRQRQIELRRGADLEAVLGQEGALAEGEAADEAGAGSGAAQGAGYGATAGTAAYGPVGGVVGGLLGGVAGGLMGYFAEDGGTVPGNKDEAVPVIAHGGELILSEDASKKLLKALADKDKGTLQAFERDILENKGVLQAFERDAPQRDKAKKDENEFTQSYGENVRSAGGYKPKYSGNVPTYEWTSGWEGPPAPEQIVAPRWAIKDIDQRFEIPEKNYPAYADAVIDERRIRYPGMTVGIRGPRSNEDGWMELAAIRREHTAGSPWYRGAPRYPSRYSIPGGQTRTGQSSQMTERQAEEILRKAKLEKTKKTNSGKGRK